eukprot:COSAG01_NODE_41687_length_448_cov_1.183381_1_plen_133_part_10
MAGGQSSLWMPAAHDAQGHCPSGQSGSGIDGLHHRRVAVLHGYFAPSSAIRPVAQGRVATFTWMSAAYARGHSSSGQSGSDIDGSHHCLPPRTCVPLLHGDLAPGHAIIDVTHSRIAPFLHQRRRHVRVTLGA